jgi:hypothetical protein
MLPQHPRSVAQDEPPAPVVPHELVEAPRRHDLIREGSELPLHAVAGGVPAVDFERVVDRHGPPQNIPRTTSRPTPVNGVSAGAGLVAPVIENDGNV